MRLALALLLASLAAPATAWEFTPDPVCTLSGADPELAVRVTYDPRTALYQIALTRAEGWPDAPRFAIAFADATGLTITTDRHRVDGPTLSVSDTGFGNVLLGLESGGQAVALSGALALPFSLAGAAPEVARFRACSAAASV
jgi:hypothetical protein